jgi:hypothetical protein
VVDKKSAKEAWDAIPTMHVSDDQVRMVVMQ